MFIDPRQPLPDDVRAVLLRIEPWQTDLVDWARGRLDDEALDEIARADYSHDAEAHHDALSAIRDQGTLPSELAWVPREVLELTEGSEPEPHDERGQLKRIFSCAVLLAVAERELYSDTLIQLIDSVTTLGPDPSRRALQLLVWRAMECREQDVEPFVAIGILILAAHLGYPEPDLLTLADWTVVECHRDLFPGMRHDAWRARARAELTTPSWRTPRLTTALETIVTWIDEAT